MNPNLLDIRISTLYHYKKEICFINELYMFLFNSLYPIKNTICSNIYFIKLLFDKKS